MSMSKTPKKINYIQTTFEELERQALSRLSSKEYKEGRFRIIDTLRAAIRSAIKSSHRDIYQIAGEMSHLLGETITKDVIYSWTRESDELNGRQKRHIPAEYIPAFCEAAESDEPLIVLSLKRGVFFPGPKAIEAEIGQYKKELRRIKKELKQREILLAELGRRFAQ